MSRSWHLFMALPYYNLAWNSKVFRPPGIPEGDELLETGWPIYTSYAMPCVFFADPAFWNVYTRTTARTQFRGTRSGEVSFPTVKMLVVETWAPSGRGGATTGEALAKGPNSAAFCDASARSIPRSQRLSGYDKGDGDEFIDDGAIHFADAPPLLHTYDGIRGRDIR